MTFLAIDGKRPKPAAHLRILWNKVSKARKPHVLKCGCTIQAGTFYHSVGTLAYSHKGKAVFLRAKQHLTGCIEKLN